MCPAAAAPTDVTRGGWTFSVFPADAPLRSAMTTCGPDGVFGLDLSHGTTATTDGTVWSFSVPNGVAIDRVRLERRVTVSQGYWYALQTDVGGIREYTSRTSASEPPPPTEWTGGAFDLKGSRWISLILACVTPTPCIPTETQTVAVRGFEADLVDESAPTIQYAVATDQVPPVKPSTFTITVDASDTGSGVKTISVLIDGVVVGQASGDGSCAANPYTVPGPCPLYSHLSAPIAREAMERGTGQLEVEAVDAAGNRTRTPAVPLSKFGYAISGARPAGSPARRPHLRLQGHDQARITSRYDAPPTITGLVRDATGAALPGVAVRIDTRLLVRDAAFAPLRDRDHRQARRVHAPPPPRPLARDPGHRTDR